MFILRSKCFNFIKKKARKKIIYIFLIFDLILKDFSRNMSNYRVLSIQSHVVHGYVGNKAAVFPLQVYIF